MDHPERLRESAAGDPVELSHEVWHNAPDPAPSVKIGSFEARDDSSLVPTGYWVFDYTLLATIPDSVASEFRPRHRECRLHGRRSPIAATHCPPARGELVLLGEPLRALENEQCALDEQIAAAGHNAELSAGGQDGHDTH
jgi:hypothetical protein